jgi:hypothetical protein
MGRIFGKITRDGESVRIVNHTQVILGLFFVILIVGMWKSGKLNAFWLQTVG